MHADVISMDVESGARAQWLRHIAVFAVLLVLLGVLYWPAIAAALTVYWVSPTFSHCYLIIPISAYLVWTKRAELRAVQPTLYLPALALFIPLAIGWFLAHLMAINEGQQFMLMGMVQALILTLFGWSVYRIVMFPALFLFFLVPTGEYLIAPLQRFTTHFITTGLSILGIPYYAEGTIVELSNGRYQVEEACAGLRFLIATVALGALFAHLTYRKWYKIVLFIAACFIVPVIGNGFRALGIVLLAHYSNNRIAVGFDHLVYGWGFSVAIMLVLFFIGARFRDDFPPEELSANTSAPSSAGALFVGLVLAALAISAGPAAAVWKEGRPLNINMTVFGAPRYVGWQTGAVSDSWAPKYSGADAKLAFSLDRDALNVPSIDVFIYYYGRPRNSHTLIESTNKMWDEEFWNAANSGQVTARLGRVPVQFGELEIASGTQRRLVWWTYWVGGNSPPVALR